MLSVIISIEFNSLWCDCVFFLLQKFFLVALAIVAGVNADVSELRLSNEYLPPLSSGSISSYSAPAFSGPSISHSFSAPISTTTYSEPIAYSAPAFSAGPSISYSAPISHSFSAPISTTYSEPISYSAPISTYSAPIALPEVSQCFWHFYLFNTQSIVWQNEEFVIQNQFESR